MTDEQKDLQKFKSELEVNASKVLKNCSEAFLNQKKERHFFTLPIVIAIIGATVSILIAILK